MPESPFLHLQRNAEADPDGIFFQSAAASMTNAEALVARIRRALESFGIVFADVQATEVELSIEVDDDSNLVRLLRKLLRMFNRTTTVSDDHLRKRFGSDFQTLESELIPFLVHEGVVDERKWRGSGSHRAWTLALGLDNLLTEGNPGPQGDVWRTLQSRR